MADDFSNEELEELFGGDESDKQLAVEAFNASRMENMWRYIKSRFPGFTPDQIHNVYQKSLGEFIQCVRRPDFDPIAPERLFITIARRRAIDESRKKAPNEVLSEWKELIEGKHRDTKMAVELRLILKEEMPKLRQALDEAIEELRGKEKDAALGFLEVHEDMRACGNAFPLAEWIRKNTDDGDCTTAKAADRWRSAKNKIERKLTAAGFRKLFEELL